MSLRNGADEAAMIVLLFRSREDGGKKYTHKKKIFKEYWSATEYVRNRLTSSKIVVILTHLMIAFELNWVPITSN